MKLQFYIRFHTRYGQSLWLTGNHDEMGNNDPDQLVPMQYLNNDYWSCTINIKKKDFPKRLIYKYVLKNEDKELLAEWGNDRVIKETNNKIDEITLVDTWCHAGEYENAFFSAPFKEVLLKANEAKIKKPHTEERTTHIFRVKAPLLKKNEMLCLLGSGPSLNDWDTNQPFMMYKEDNWWIAEINLEKSDFPVAYKYGVYDTKTKSFLYYESENNRLVYSDVEERKLTILHDGFAHLPNNTWKGAGLAIPVFSLRSKKGFGVGEFNDIQLLVDWAKKTGLKLIQLLPVNDTIANHNWLDSYPYAAISAFALHPIYINLESVAGKEYSTKVEILTNKRKELNTLSTVDYEQVVNYKLSVLKELYDLLGSDCFGKEDYTLFFGENKHWLKPYAVFCYLRDKYKTIRSDEWASHNIYNRKEVDELFNEEFKSGGVGFYCFVQYHLHKQLQSAADYAHKKGVVLKGDIPIGIYRHGCDAWVAPELYNMCWQAGAPPDDFTAVGQNWGFPTYNWKQMQEDGFAWWKQRFTQMSNYFDAFRIDHILGFFRIWSIPAHAVQGIMGRFVPCLPVHINEFGEKGIWMDHQRLCRPFINNIILDEIFGDLAEQVKKEFLDANRFGGYDLKPVFDTQTQVELYFAEQKNNPANDKIKSGLFDLISNVILFEEENSNGEHFHFRIAMEKTSSFKYLPHEEQEKLKALYIDYFYKRQDDFWFKEAMHKLPHLKAATNMLVCGEDLGMVPHCVPEVMRQLGLLSLEIQRMPKDPEKEFSLPNDAPYLSVITPSTHDMSTVRGWWEESRERTQNFYNHILGQWGEAPLFCESWISRAIILQHLYSPAMWSIFQLQDILGMNDSLRRENPAEERINNPANPKNYWQYRMHISLEELMKQKEFNDELKGYVENSGRA